LALPVALVLLGWILFSTWRGHAARVEGIVLLLWSLAAVLNVHVRPIEYQEQAGPWTPHVGAAVTALHPLAGLVPLSVVATLSVALIAAARLNLVPS
jgi:hypothetical protein